MAKEIVKKHRSEIMEELAQVYVDAVDIDGLTSNYKYILINGNGKGLSELTDEELLEDYLEDCEVDSDTEIQIVPNDEVIVRD